MGKIKVFKRQDIITILILTISGVAAAYFATNSLLGDPSDKKASFKTIGEISPTVASPDSEVFNLDALNPTVEVYVGSCEDVDQNGILSAAELSACGEAQVEEDETDPEEPEMLQCPSGEMVTSLDQCPVEEPDEGSEDEEEE